MTEQTFFDISQWRRQPKQRAGVRGGKHLIFAAWLASEPETLLVGHQGEEKRNQIGRLAPAKPALEPPCAGGDGKV
jgi:hypothetical protein